MKIDHPDTPFLFLDADDPCGEVAAIHPKYLSTHIPMAERTGAPLCGRGPSPMWGTRPFGRLASPTRPVLVDPRSCPEHPLALVVPARRSPGRTLVGGGVYHIGAPGPHQMQVKDLQDALGLVMTDEGGLASFTRPKWAHAESFGAQRQVSG